MRTVNSFVTEQFLTLRGHLTTTPLHKRRDLPGANFVVNGADAARGVLLNSATASCSRTPFPVRNLSACGRRTEVEGRWSKRSF